MRIAVPMIGMFVNVHIAGPDLCEAGFADFVRDTTAGFDLPARSLMLELTENTLMSSVDGAIATLAQLRRHRVRVAVDDFGTGYSSASPLPAPGHAGKAALWGQFDEHQSACGAPPFQRAGSHRVALACAPSAAGPALLPCAAGALA